VHDYFAAVIRWSPPPPPWATTGYRLPTLRVDPLGMSKLQAQGNALGSWP